MVTLVVGEAHVYVAVVVALVFRVLEQATRFVVQFLERLSGVPGLDVPLKVPPPHQHLATEIAPVRRVALGVEPDVLVQVARVAERPEAHFALQGLVTRMSPHVDFQAIFPGVQLPAVKTQVSLFGFAGRWVAGGPGGHRVQSRPVFLRCDFSQLLRVHSDLTIDVGDGA